MGSPSFQNRIGQMYRRNYKRAISLCSRSPLCVRIS
jgi:hypothetical protein